jgi:hypothetical protein
MRQTRALFWTCATFLVLGLGYVLVLGWWHR